MNLVFYNNNNSGLAKGSVWYHIGILLKDTTWPFQPRMRETETENVQKAQTAVDV